MVVGAVRTNRMQRTRVRAAVGSRTSAARGGRWIRHVRHCVTQHCGANARQSSAVEGPRCLVFVSCAGHLSVLPAFVLRLGARASPGFFPMVGNRSGFSICGGASSRAIPPLVFWFSRVPVIPDFIARAGLKQGVNRFGWCAAWLALGLRPD